MFLQNTFANGIYRLGDSIDRIAFPWILIATAFLNTTFESFRNPATTTFVRLILPQEHYEYGISFFQTSSRISELIGTAIAGVMIATIGIFKVIVLDAITFFLSALCIQFIKIKEQKKRI